MFGFHPILLQVVLRASTNPKTLPGDPPKWYSPLQRGKTAALEAKKTADATTFRELPVVRFPEKSVIWICNAQKKQEILAHASCPGPPNPEMFFFFCRQCFSPKSTCCTEVHRFIQQWWQRISFTDSWKRMGSCSHPNKCSKPFWLVWNQQLKLLIYWCWWPSH